MTPRCVYVNLHGERCTEAAISLYWSYDRIFCSVACAAKWGLRTWLREDR